LGGLSHKIGYHIAGWAPLHSHLLFVYPVCYKKVADMDMFRALAARSLAVLLKKDDPFGGKWFNSFTAMNTMCIVISFGIRLKGRLCRSD
jgi:hypothetical protein